MEETVRNTKSYTAYHLKDIFDFLIVLVLILLLSPIIFIIGFVVSNKIGNPIIFKQQRPGKNGIPFILFKFRTMTDTKDEKGRLLSDAERITTFGKILRATSLDELPSLFNVLKGEMSLVGPRPLLMHYLPLYSPEQSRRHELKPGITGWAQVNGRNAITWEEKFKLDVWYVDHISFRLDMKILFMTIWKTLKRSDITESGHATVSEFMGSKTESAK